MLIQGQCMNCGEYIKVKDGMCSTYTKKCSCEKSGLRIIKDRGIVLLGMLEIKFVRTFLDSYTLLISPHSVPKKRRKKEEIFNCKHCGRQDIRTTKSKTTCFDCTLTRRRNVYNKKHNGLIDTQ